MSDTEFWYRMDYVLVGDEYNTRVDVRTSRHRVVKSTPQGVWLDMGYNVAKRGHDTRFVLRNARKRWACPTEEEARESFIARKRRQLNILEHQVQYVRDALALAGAPCPVTPASLDREALHG